MKVIYSNDGYGIPYGLTIVCPTTFMNNWMKDVPDSFSFYENMWQVDKEGYDKCQVSIHYSFQPAPVLIAGTGRYRD